MAGARNYKYEYETSPRKLKPDYIPEQKVIKKKKSTVDVKKLEKQRKEKLKIESKKKFKLTVCVCITFGILFAISYRYSLINEQFNNVQNLKKQLVVVQKENERLEVDVENKLNLSNIEQSAKERLGMQKLESKQSVYITLDKKDYIASATPEIIVNKEESSFAKIINALKSFLQ